MRFTTGSAVPSLSFTLDGEPSERFLETCQRQTTTEIVPGGALERTRYVHQASGLIITLTARRFDASGAVDWVVELENGGQADSPLLESILPLDLTVSVPAKERLRLHHAKGSSCQMDDFLPLVTELRPGAREKLAPRGGRSSNGTLPFMNLQRDGCGMVLAIGWSGQWAVWLERTAESLRIAAGMEQTRLRLRPGEKMRTPRILLLPWDGTDPERGNNLLRRLLMEHYLPRLDGELVMPPTAQCLQAYFYLTGRASAAYEMTALPKAAQLGVEAYWIDACWYGEEGEWWEQVGSWVVNRQRFPDGLRPISDAAHDAGMKFVLWFEPERVRRGSKLHREHPEWLLSREGDPANLLFNLGLPEARAYLTNLISDAIAEHGVDIYRQDFNFDPLPYWQAADAPDRVGMTEIHHIEGFYAFWDELRQRHPRLWIDNCASGGRRIDLETCSRSLPLWPSDFPDVVGLPFGQGLHVGDQCICAGLARWVPLFGGGVWNFSPYGTRSQIIGGFTFGYHVADEDLPADDEPTVLTHKDVLARGKTLLDEDFPMEAAAAAIAEWRSIRPFFLGDFHLLLPVTVGYHDWCAWQFHRTDLDAGIALFFRRHQSPFPEMEVALRGIAPEAEYEVSQSRGYDEGPRQRLSGSALVRLSVAIPEAPGSVLLRYRRV